jgi:hypothetical protein
MQHEGLHINHPVIVKALGLPDLLGTIGLNRNPLAKDTLIADCPRHDGER